MPFHTLLNVIMASLVIALGASSAGAIEIKSDADKGTSTLQTRYGVIKVNAQGAVYFNDKRIQKLALPNAKSSDFIDLFEMSSSDVILMSQAANKTCPGRYTFLRVNKDKVSVTPTFGTCSEEALQPLKNGDKISFSMRNVKRKGYSTYVYENGVLLVNGTVAK